MSIQTTNRITRKQAEEMFVEKMTNNIQDKLLRIAKIHTNAKLEDFIQTTFDNYIIMDENNVIGKQGVCRCGKIGMYQINPYDQDMFDMEVIECLCNECYLDSVMSI